MPKLYIFGIGGTGARVLKALTMLFASGCVLDNDFDTVIPIIIDPDTGNGDLNRTTEILKLYQEIRSKINNPDDFFKQELKTINNLLTGSRQIEAHAFKFNLEGIGANKFRDYMNYVNMSPDNQKFMQALYSQANLAANLNIGFKGNPNMGAIVLDQFTRSQDYVNFGTSFNSGDAIFIISSIFGGTGAAGFPLLLKNIRSGENTINGKQVPNAAVAIQQAPLGALTLLPYFKLQPDGEIDSDTFLEKARTALDYYNRTIIDTNQIDTIYFLGDELTQSIYANKAGDAGQQNMAHFLELAGALAIFDFCRNMPAPHADGSRPQIQTKVKEFGINDVAGISPLTFKSLAQPDAELISLSLKKFYLFVNYLHSGLTMGKSAWTINVKLQAIKTPLDSNFFESTAYTNSLCGFNRYFREWVKELCDNQPSFDPFYDRANDKTTYRVLDSANNREVTSVEKSDDKVLTSLVKLFGKTTNYVANKQKL